MSNKSQSANMKILAQLLSNDLGYICGEKESGPNGAKKQFLSKGRAFLLALGKDLGFTEMSIRKNPSGIACSGEVTLMGMWPEGNWLFVELYQDLMRNNCIMYRSIRHLFDYTGGGNNFISIGELSIGDYEDLVSQLLRMKGAEHELNAA